MNRYLVWVQYDSGITYARESVLVEAETAPAAERRALCIVAQRAQRWVHECHVHDLRLADQQWGDRDCKHGHLGCSWRQDGPCFDETHPPRGDDARAE